MSSAKDYRSSKYKQKVPFIDCICTNIKDDTVLSYGQTRSESLREEEIDLARQYGSGHLTFVDVKTRPAALYNRKLFQKYCNHIFCNSINNK